MGRSSNPPHIWIHELPLESQRKVIALALLVVEDLASGNDWHAVDRIEFSHMNNEEYIGFWSLLNSTQRTAIKSMQDCK